MDSLRHSHTKLEFLLSLSEENHSQMGSLVRLRYSLYIHGNNHIITIIKYILLIFTYVVGFLLRILPITKTKANSSWEKQIEVLLGTWDPTCMRLVLIYMKIIFYLETGHSLIIYVALYCVSRINKNVLCILRRCWIEAVLQALQDVIDIEEPPFIYVLYVMMEAHLPSSLQLHCYVTVWGGFKGQLSSPAHALVLQAGEGEP